MPGMMKKAVAKSNKSKKMNPLDKAIIKGKKLPSKNKKPGRYLDK